MDESGKMFAFQFDNSLDCNAQLSETCYRCSRPCRSGGMASLLENAWANHTNPYLPHLVTAIQTTGSKYGIVNLYRFVTGTA
jgi:hypothetical protein